MANLANLPSSAAVIQMHKMPGPKVRVKATKVMAITGMAIVMVVVMGRPVVGPIPWMPMSSRGI